jgi:putative two-component system hydrogenase maturation factor HypX/HoxX
VLNGVRAKPPRVITVDSATRTCSYFRLLPNTSFASVTSGPVRGRPSKSSLYRGQVTEAAVRGVLEAVARIESGEFQSGTWQPEKSSDGSSYRPGCLRAPMRQADRAIDWVQDETAAVVRKIRTADSAPGVLSTLFGKSYFLYGAHEEQRLKGPPGQILARRDGAICISTVDGAVWVSHLKSKGERGAQTPTSHAEPSSVDGIKLPAAQVLGPLLRGVPDRPLSIDAPADHRTFREIFYTEEADVGYLSFDFYNGAMSTAQCYRLRDAFLYARSRPTRVIVLLGGRNFWSNGIDLNTIEASVDPAEESWRNINAIDDLIVEILNTTCHIVIAGLRGNAGAGGAMLALAADYVYATCGVVLNPHYRSMGLYGSEYWTYTLPRRVGQKLVTDRASDRIPPATISGRTSQSGVTGSQSRNFSYASSLNGRPARKSDHAPLSIAIRSNPSVRHFPTRDTSRPQPWTRSAARFRRVPVWLA